MGKISTWFGERVPVSSETLVAITNEPVPNHLRRWWFCLGGTPAYMFIVQILTGIMLAFYYEGSPDRAYESVAYITNEASYGWFLRSLHKWGATMMVASVILHQMRVYFTGAYRKPREINWMIGVFLLFCTLMLGFTGYSLVYEQLSFWGASVGANIMDNVPLIGGFMKQMLLAGDSYNQHTMSRFYVLHAAVLPAAMIFLLIMHVALIRMQGITEFEFDDQKDTKKKTFNFFPDHLLTELMIGLSLMVLLSALAIALPAEMGERANPNITPEVIKPEWFFYVAFRWLKIFTGVTAVVSMAVIVVLMFLWPFLDAAIRRRRPGSEFSVWIGIVAVLFIIGLTVWEGAVAH
ncbi:MAG: cytochrome b [Planctomycetota bacterium]|jgi:quinol-cytochrome oxidoreductase complex cytochrome b subunit